MTVVVSLSAGLLNIYFRVHSQLFNSFTLVVKDCKTLSTTCILTKKSLSQTPNQPRIPVFYTLTKIHKKNPVGRPIISGCDGPTERISSFIDNILQPIAKRSEIVSQRYGRLH